MQKIRLVHFYLGVFFAPLVIFFAFTGTLQVFKLHERNRDNGTAAIQADWIAWFGQFHKEQAWIPPKARAAPAKVAPPKDVPSDPPKVEKQRSLLMMWFVALMGASLAVTTLLGLYMAYNYPRRRKGFLVALGLGIVIPLALMAT
jgi:hypothetical protein